MSIAIMSKAWASGPENMGEKLVLLAFADFANDDGDCWPSIAVIARKCSATERGIQKIIRRLIDGGWLEVAPQKGPRGCNLYTVHPEPRSPEQSSPRTRFTPNKSALPPNEVRETPERGSPEPSGTIINHQGGACAPSEPVSENRKQVSSHAHSQQAKLEDSAASEPCRVSKSDTDPPRRNGKPANSGKRGSRLNPSWGLTPELCAIASEFGLSRQEADWEADKFRDYWLSACGKNAVKRDWTRTWRSWVRRRAEDRMPAGRPRRSTSYQLSPEEAAARDRIAAEMGV